MIKLILQMLYRRIWPCQKHDLLIRIFLGDRNQSASLWKKWESHFDFDLLAWEDQKLLVRIAPKFSQYFPDSPVRPRIEGIAKSYWTQSQLLLRNSSQAVEILLQAGMPVMLFKGAAMQCYGLNHIGPRMSSDLDLIVKTADFSEAVERLYEQGWKSKNSMSFAKSFWHFASGINLRKAPFGDIDIHHQPTGMSFMIADCLDGIWQRAEPREFLGKHILVPSLADMLVIFACHALKGSKETEVPGIWIFDLIAIIQAGVTATEIKKVASQYQAKIAVMAILSYAYEVTADEKIEQLLREIEGVPISISDIYRYLLDSNKTSTFNLQSIFFKILKLLPRGGGQKKFRKRMPKSYPLLIPSFLLKALDNQSSNSTCLVRHTVDLSQMSSLPKWIVLRLSFIPPVARKYQFDLILDGVATSRLRANISRSQCNKMIDIQFIIQLRNNPQRLEIESIAMNSLIVNTKTTDLEKIQPIPFSFKMLHFKYLYTLSTARYFC